MFNSATWLVGVCARFKKVIYVTGDGEFKLSSKQAGEDYEEEDNKDEKYDEGDQNKERINIGYAMRVVRSWAEDKEMHGRLVVLDHQVLDLEVEGEGREVVGRKLSRLLERRSGQRSLLASLLLGKLMGFSLRITP